MKMNLLKCIRLEGYLKFLFRSLSLLFTFMDSLKRLLKLTLCTDLMLQTLSRWNLGVHLRFRILTKK